MKQTVAIGDDDELESDLVVACIGLPPNRDSINNLVDSQYIDENGRIKVNGYLQVEGMKNKKIFAIGDCCNTQEDKMAAYAGKQAELLVNNITMTLRGYRMEELKEYSRVTSRTFLDNEFIFVLCSHSSECWCLLGLEKELDISKTSCYQTLLADF